MHTMFGRGKRGARDGGGGKDTVQGRRLFVLIGWGTRGSREVCEGVGIQEVIVRRVERDYIVRGGEGIEGLREWIQLGQVLGGGGGGWSRRAVDGDRLTLSGLGLGPGPIGCRDLEEGRDEKRLKRLPSLAHHFWQKQLERQPGGGQRRRVQITDLGKTTEASRTPRT